jgi:hypothetical protein
VNGNCVHPELTGDCAMTSYRHRRLLDALEKAVKSNVTPVASPEPGVCGVCESEIEAGAGAVTLPGPKQSISIVCGDCFELFRLCPGPRPMV